MVDAEKREVDVGKRVVGYKKRWWMLEVVVHHVVHITVVVVKVTAVNIKSQNSPMAPVKGAVVTLRVEMQQTRWQI